MRKKTLAIIVLSLIFAFAVTAMAATDAFNIDRFILCKKIVDREPSGITNSFPKDTEKVYVFIDARDITEESLVKIQWLFEGEEVSLIELRLGTGSRWRTYSSKQIGVRKGKWIVRLKDTDDNVLKELKFKVR